MTENNKGSSMSIGSQEGAVTVFERSKPVVDYILSLGWGDKSSWEKASNKENNDLHSESVTRGLRRPHVAEAYDKERVERFEERIEREAKTKEEEERHRFSIAFEKSLVILGNMDDIKFFGNNIDMCLSSRYDDYFRNADIVAKANHNGKEVLFSIDVTTSTSEKNLDDKNYRLGNPIKYCPSHYKKKERTFEKQKETQMASGVLVGLSPERAYDVIVLAATALGTDRLRDGLKPDEIKRRCENIKLSPARVHLLEQIMQQVGFQSRTEHERSDCYPLLDCISGARSQVIEEGSEHSDIYAKDEVCKYVEGRN